MNRWHQSTTGRNNVPACWDCCSTEGSNYFEAFLAGFAALAAGLALADLAGLAAFFGAVAFGAAFFVAISLASFRKNFWAPVRGSCRFSLVPK